MRDWHVGPRRDFIRHLSERKALQVDRAADVVLFWFICFVVFALCGAYWL